MKNNPDRNNERAKEWYEKNKERAKEYRREYYQKNKARQRELEKARKEADPAAWKEAKRWHGIKQKYGLTKTEYFAIYDAQDGACALCHTKDIDAGGLHIDHCHTTMKVRGLLCGHCNKALGLFRDNSTTLRRAADYLDGTQNG